MTRHPGFYTDRVHGQTIYRCATKGCQWDGFNMGRAKGHAAQHPPINLPGTELPAQEWLQNITNSGRFLGKRVLICFLTWNTQEASLKGIRAAAKEVGYLKLVGASEPKLLWIDNGSDDGTEFMHLPDQFGATQQFDENVGQSAARNYALDYAKQNGYDYIIFVDGDIEMIQFSSIALMDAMMLSHYICVGINCHNCTDDETDPTVSQECREIPLDSLSIQPHIAWTQYGIFDNRFIVQHKWRFEERGPFAGPGWGFEDDDFGLQMLSSGYVVANTPLFRFMHRTRHSSLRLLDRSLAAKVYDERKAFVVDKWKNDPACEKYVRMMSNQSIYWDTVLA